MAVKVRERPPGSGKWWIFVDWKGKRKASFIPQGKRAAEEVAKRITERFKLIETNERAGVSVSLREMVLGRPDPPAPPAPSVAGPSGPLFGPYAESWLESCEARGLKHTTYRAYKVILETHLKPAFGEKHLSELRELHYQLAVLDALYLLVGAFGKDRGSTALPALVCSFPLSLLISTRLFPECGRCQRGTEDV